MPLYGVSSLDAWGNVVDGFEVNNSSVVGEVYLLPVYLQDDESIIRTLIASRHLSANALQLFREGELQVEGDDPGSFTIDEQETAWVIIGVDGEARYGGDSEQEAQEAAEKEETVEAQDGFRPVLNLAEVEPPHKKYDKPFWRSKQKVSTGAVTHKVVVPDGDGQTEPKTQHNIEVEASFSQDGRTIVFNIFEAGHPDGSEGPQADEFPYHYDDWRKQRTHQIGFNPVSGEEFELSDDDALERLVLAAEIYRLLKLRIVGEPELPADLKRLVKEITWGQEGDGAVKVVADYLLDRGLLTDRPFDEGDPVDAERIAKAIQENVDDYFRKEIDHEEFGRRNSALWDEAMELKVTDQVRDVLRSSTPHLEELENG